jgi:trk system potassium uptake protein TrkH
VGHGAVRVLGAGLLVAVAVADHALPAGPATRLGALALSAVLGLVLVLDSVRRLPRPGRMLVALRTRLVELALTAGALLLLASKVAVGLAAIGDPGEAARLAASYLQYALGFLLVAGLRAVAGGVTLRRLFQRLDLRPAQTVAVSFAVAVGVGTLLLALPVSLVRVEELSLLDALFTATSAVTVTGLTVYNVSEHHSLFGQAVLMGLIQLGGLGTMVLSASLVVLAGRRLRLRRAAAVQETLDLETLGEVRGQVLAIVAITLAVEAAGALGLWLLWRGRPEVPLPAFAAAFHAVAAFCNAGFSTLPEGLVPFRAHAGTTGLVALLIVVGGLGFPVLRVLPRWRPPGWRGARRPLPLHARLVLITTAVLLAGGALGVLALETRGVLAPLGWGERLLAAGFLSVTARTAGFNTLDTAALGAATLELLLFLMFVGASPGSTGGGVKTTTAATVVAALRATLGGRAQVTAFRRSIHPEQVNKALGLVGVAFAVNLLGITLLLATQAPEPRTLVFEAVSAFGTVGLSAGATPGLDAWGKLVVAGLMFVGRTGPLTLAFALAATANARVVYPAEHVMIG